MKFLIAFLAFCFLVISAIAQDDSVYTTTFKEVRPATVKDSTIWIVPLDTLIWVGRNKALKVWVRNQGWPSRYLRVFDMGNVNGMTVDSVLMEVIVRPVTVKWHK